MSILACSLLLTGLMLVIAIGVKTENYREVNTLKRELRRLERENRVLTTTLDETRTQAQILRAKVSELNEAKNAEKSVNQRVRIVL